MDVATLEVPKAEARKLAAEYLRSVRERRKSELDEVERRLLEEDKALLAGYRALSQGKQVIKLDDVIRDGGVDDRGLPKLAAVQSDAEWCWVERGQDGTVSFRPWASRWSRREKGRIRLRNALPTCSQMGHPISPSGWCTMIHGTWDGEVRALVPTVPAPLRPAHHLRNYVTLFEVPRWERAPRPPGDPYLLKHLHGHLYAVVAQWDLTPLEKAVLAGRT